jgi:hypothetical protein
VCILGEKEAGFNLFLTLRAEHKRREIGRIVKNNKDRIEHGPPLNRAEKHKPKSAQKYKEKDLIP